MHRPRKWNEDENRAEKKNTKILSEDEMYTQTNTPPYSEDRKNARRNERERFRIRAIDA